MSGMSSGDGHAISGHLYRYQLHSPRSDPMNRPDPVPKLNLSLSFPFRRDLLYIW